MAYETVNGYCWPQSVAPGEPVSLHVSSAGGRPVSIEVARIGRRRDVVFEEHGIPASDHATPTDAPEHGCGWPAAAEIAVGSGWRSGYYEVLLTIGVDAKQRSSRAFFVVRPDLATTTATMLWAIDTNTWHAYNDFGGRNLYTGATQSSMLRPMAPGYLYKPPGAGQRVTSIHPPTRSRPPRRLPADEPPVAVRRLGGLARLERAVRRVGRARGLRDRRRHQRRPRGAPRAARARVAVLAVPVDRPRRVLVGADARHGGGVHRPGRHAAFFSGNTSFWQVRSRTRRVPTAPGRRRRWSATRACSSATPCSAPIARPS
jgi:hypothetical protein